MSWTTIDLTTINPAMDIVPEKLFTFELLPGAKISDRNADDIDFAVAIVNDGDFTGRKLYGKYTFGATKSPNEKALKRLEQAMGVDANVGEDPIAYLNRASGGRFSTNVRHSKPSEEYPQPKAFLDLWNVKPAN